MPKRPFAWIEFMICIPVMARNTEEALPKIRAAGEMGDVVELRLDGMESFRLGEMIRACPRPAMVTYRSRREGGRGDASEDARSLLLLQAIEAGAMFVDVERSLHPECRQRVIREKAATKVVLSAHFHEGTPNHRLLERLLREMAGEGADVVKIVTRARVPEDNLRVLSLIPTAHALGMEIIAFCMGRAGRLSRIVSPLLGGYMTFASLAEGDESAAGQIPAGRMKEILEVLRA
ncbi:MAG: type I 3-dehydroquinate dehydratase [Thermodesulfobacteriota bacterium]